jgi:hypothetical protein
VGGIISFWWAASFRYGGRHHLVLVSGFARNQHSDAVTCSTACRVRAHRTGAVKRHAKFAADFGVQDAALLLRQHALVRLFGKKADKMVKRRPGETKRQARLRWQAAAAAKLELLMHEAVTAPAT